MIVVLSEASVDQSSLNARETTQITETARLLGCRVYTIPRTFEVCDTAENALAYVPHFEPEVPGVWVGYIPSVERYAAIYEAALAKGIRLLNSPEQYQLATEFDRYVTLLGELTPASVALRSVDECSGVGELLGYPVFVRGSVKSNKSEGWQACVAHDEDELISLVEQVLAKNHRSRGRVVVREFARLRHDRVMPDGFPVSREYRAFLYNQRVLAYGYYWDEHEDDYHLTAGDEHSILALAVETAHRVGVPFMIVDIAQLESGEWIVIEIGDAQFAGLSRIPVLKLWGAIKDIT